MCLPCLPVGEFGYHTEPFCWVLCCPAQEKQYARMPLNPVVLYFTIASEGLVFAFGVAQRSDVERSRERIWCLLCCVSPLYRVVPYTDKQIVGISGRTAGFVHQLTLHYSDGSSKTNGQEGGGDPVPIQQWDPGPLMTT